MSAVNSLVATPPGWSIPNSMHFAVFAPGMYVHPWSRLCCVSHCLVGRADWRVGALACLFTSLASLLFDVWLGQ